MGLLGDLYSTPQRGLLDDPADEAAFGVYPHIARRKKANNDREGAKEMPVQMLRGMLAGTLGLPGDVEGLARIGARFMGANVDTTPALPTSDFYSEALPVPPTAPAGRAAVGLGAALGLPTSGLGMTAARGAAPAVRAVAGRVAENAASPTPWNMATKNQLGAVIYHGSPTGLLGEPARSMIGQGQLSESLMKPTTQQLKAWEFGMKHRAQMEKDGISRFSHMESLPEDELRFVSMLEDRAPVSRGFYESALRGADMPKPASGYRYGTAPKEGTSWNHVDQRPELGVSMAKVEGVPYQWYPMNTTGARANYDGWLLDQDKFWGSDGEPLMLGLKIKPKK